MKTTNYKYRSISGIFTTVVLAAVLFLSTGLLYGAGDDFFLRQQIDVPGTVLGSREADFSGDGRTDLVLFVSEPNGRRTLRSYIQRESGRFPPAAGQIIEISSSVNMVQCLDLKNDGSTELFLVDGDGVWQYSHDGEKFNDRGKNIIPARTLFAAGIEGGLLSQDCVHTIQGRPVIFLPILGGYWLWEYSQGEFKELARLNFSHLFSTASRPVKLFSGRNHNRQENFQINIPAIVIDDGNGDDLDDIYLIWADRLAIINQNNQGRFDSSDGLFFQFQDPSAENLCQSRLVDFDRDGRLDVVCSRSQGGISGAQTDINFFHSTQIRRRDRNETYTVSLTDVCGNLIIDDFDGQGGPELVIPAVELGIMSTVKKMITKKTDFHILIYPIDNLGRPAQEPSVRKKISCRLDFEHADPTANIRIDWSGDYDGDGLLDLIVADGGGQLIFYQGAPEKYLENKADLVIDMVNPDELRPINLNSDGRTDLIVIHKPTGGATRLTLLVTNRIG